MQTTSLREKNTAASGYQRGLAHHLFGRELPPRTLRFAYQADVAFLEERFRDTPWRALWGYQ
jgi:hypothetical protein